MRSYHTRIWHRVRILQSIHVQELAGKWVQQGTPQLSDSTDVDFTQAVQFLGQLFLQDLRLGIPLDEALFDMVADFNAGNAELLVEEALHPALANRVRGLLS